MEAWKGTEQADRGEVEAAQQDSGRAACPASALLGAS